MFVKFVCFTSLLYSRGGDQLNMIMCNLQSTVLFRVSRKVYNWSKSRAAEYVGQELPRDI